MDTPRRQAAKQGNPRYHGKPCRKCGNTERLTTTGACVPCARIYNKRLRDEIREMLAKARANAEVG